jgi:hypothetical protein
MKFIANPEDRMAVTVVAAGVAMHALIAGKHLDARDDADVKAAVARAFMIAEAFVAEAERRWPRTP